MRARTGHTHEMRHEQADESDQPRGGDCARREKRGRDIDRQRDARELLGPDRWRREHSAGGGMSIDQLMGEIDVHMARLTPQRRMRHPAPRPGPTES